MIVPIAPGGQVKNIVKLDIMSQKFVYTPLIASQFGDFSPQIEEILLQIEQLQALDEIRKLIEKRAPYFKKKEYYEKFLCFCCCPVCKYDGLLRKTQLLFVDLLKQLKKEAEDISVIGMKKYNIQFIPKARTKYFKTGWVYKIVKEYATMYFEISIITPQQIVQNNSYQ